METCPNCGSKVEKLGILAEGTSEEQGCCCEHCAFHPLGCRCKYGEFGVAETQQYFDPDFDDDDSEMTDAEEIALIEAYERKVELYGEDEDLWPQDDEANSTFGDYDEDYEDF